MNIQTYWQLMSLFALGTLLHIGYGINYPPEQTLTLTTCVKHYSKGTGEKHTVKSVQCPQTVKLDLKYYP